MTMYENVLCALQDFNPLPAGTCGSCIRVYTYEEYDHSVVDGLKDGQDMLLKVL